MSSVLLSPVILTLLTLSSTPKPADFSSEWRDFLCVAKFTNAPGTRGHVASSKSLAEELLQLKKIRSDEDSIKSVVTLTFVEGTSKRSLLRPLFQSICVRLSPTLLSLASLYQI